MFPRTNATTGTQAKENQLSEDQRAVAEYFASDVYTHADIRRRRAARGASRDHWPNHSLSPLTSLWLGLIGLSAMLLVAATLAPMLAALLRAAVNPEDHFVVFTLLHQTAVLPAMVGFTFVIVATMFWCGSVAAKFPLAFLLAVPGGCAALGFATPVKHLGLSGSQLAIITVAIYLLIATVAVVLQMWSRWTLSHSRPVDSLRDPTSTRAIMELTTVAALGCTLLMSMNMSDIVEPLLLFAALAVLLTFAALAMIIAVLRVDRRNLFAASLALLFAFSSSAVYSSAIAFDVFGWSKLPRLIVPILGSAAYGTMVICGVFWIAVMWMRGCGWICLSRQDERRVRERDKHSPWRWFRVAQ